MTKDAVVVHSGGLDSTLCLALAIRRYSAEKVLSLSFDYRQRNRAELACAAAIAKDWNVDHAVIDLSCLSSLTRDAMTCKEVAVEWKVGETSSTLVVGRNGLMARLAAIHAHHLGAHCIYMGIMDEEARLFGYRDCSRPFMDLVEAALRIDCDDPSFSIYTPLVAGTKEDVLIQAHELGILDYLLTKTVSCYEGLSHLGCTQCPSCFLKLRAIAAFSRSYPDVVLPYSSLNH